MSEPLPRAAVAAIGDELLSGDQLDTNSSWLAGRLGELGWTVERVVLVGDELEEIAEVLEDLARRYSLVVTTGGLGPTLDDVTRHAVARAAGVELESDPQVVERIRAWFASRDRIAAPSNERQALFPAGAVRMPNSAGTAPGFRVRVGEAWVVSLPGPPREMHQVFEEQLIPWMAELPAAQEVIRLRRFYLFGLGESDFAERVGEWMQREANPRIGVTAGGGVLSVKLEARGTDAETAEALVEERAAAFRARFGRWIFSEDQARSDPAAALGALLIERGVSFACVESCTGGLVASRLIGVPGISSVFLEGFVTYSNEAKIGRLGVPEELLEAHGAVSREVAAVLAAGAAERSGARLAISTTGVAGPGGGSPEKPVGLVHIGVSFDGEVQTHELRLIDRGRAFVRNWATNSALDLARRRLAAESP